MARQQRTNYRRQRLTPSAPRQYSDLAWTITDVVDNAVTIEVSGDFTGAVYESFPAFALVGTINALDDVTFYHDGNPSHVGTMIASFLDDLPASFVLQLATRSTKLRNTFGGGLSAGKETWIGPPDPPQNMEYGGHSNTSSLLSLDLVTTSANVGYFNAGDVIQNQTTSEWGNPVSWNGISLGVEFSLSNLTSGDIIHVYGPDARIFNSDGGHIAEMTFGIE